MASKSQIKVTSNINFPRNDDVDGKDSKLARTATFTRGQTLTVGEDVSKDRAEWLVSKKYATRLSAKGDEVDDKGKPSGSESDAAVLAATRQASAENTAASTPPPASEDEEEAKAPSAPRPTHSGRSK